MTIRKRFAQCSRRITCDSQYSLTSNSLFVIITQNVSILRQNHYLLINLFHLEKSPTISPLSLTVFCFSICTHLSGNKNRDRGSYGKICHPGVPSNILQNRSVGLVVWHAVSTLSYLMLLPSGTVHKYSLSIN